MGGSGNQFLRVHYVGPFLPYLLDTFTMFFAEHLCCARMMAAPRTVARPRCPAEAAEARPRGEDRARRIKERK